MSACQRPLSMLADRDSIFIRILGFELLGRNHHVSITRFELPLFLKRRSLRHRLEITAVAR